MEHVNCCSVCAVSHQGWAATAGERDVMGDFLPDDASKFECVECSYSALCNVFWPAGAFFLATVSLCPVPRRRNDSSLVGRTGTGCAGSASVATRPPSWSQSKFKRRSVGKPSANNFADVQGRSKRSTATKTGMESQSTQHVRGCVSSRLFLSFSKPISTLRCSPCSPARASLQYETMSPTW